MLTEKQGVEYSKDGTIWQSSNFIQELETETSYTLYCRYAETNNYYASEKSTVQVTTNADFFKWSGKTISGVTSLGRTQSMLVIPSSCRSIFDYALAYNGSSIGMRAKEVIVLDGTTKIGTMAFRQTPNLQKITLPSTLLSIADSAFYMIDDLTEVNIYSKNVEFGSNVFGDTPIWRGDGVIRGYSGSTVEEYATTMRYTFESLDEAVTMYSLEIKSELSTTEPTIIPTTRPIVTESPTPITTPSNTPKNTIQPTAVPTVMPSTMKSTPMPAAIPTTSPTVAPEIIEKQEVTKEIILEEIKDYKTFGNVTQGDITLN